MAKQDILKRFKNVNLKKCNEACYQYLECNSYQYNEEEKLCELSNVTQLTDKLKPNGSWDVYIINPVYTETDCGQPKDIARASKSYNTTTFHSEVTYSCPGGHKLKAICKEGNRWLPVMTSCKVAENHFVKIVSAALDISGKILWKKERVTAEACAEKSDEDIFTFKNAILDVQDVFEPLKNLSLKECKGACLQTPGCSSYKYNEMAKTCHGNNASHLTHNVKLNKKGWDTYIINPANEEHIMLKKVSIPGRDILGVLPNVNLKECNKACHQYPGCNSYAYDEKGKVCSLSDVSQLTGVLKPKNVNADIYIINPVYTKVNCGPPIDVIGASKSYKTTTYKSEVIYSCPMAEKLKSICDKDNKWSPVAPVCKVYAHINCGPPKEVVGALMNYKTTTYKSNVIYTCPRGEQLKSICELGNRWTFVVPSCNADGAPLVLKNTSIASKHTFERLENLTLADCQEGCYLYTDCSSYSFNTKAEICELSRANELSHIIHHDSESLEVHVLNQAHKKIDCGPPKDIAGAKMSYSATTYRAEVIYTCPGGETVESVCKEDDRWTPVASDCRDTQMHFVKVSGAILHVPGKILWNENVTAEDCANECLSDDTCLSFEISRGSGKCYISKESAASSNRLKPTNKRDYYQRIKPDDELYIIKRTSIPGKDTFGLLKNVNLEECRQACHQTPECNSFDYNERAQVCDRSNATHLTYNLQPSKWGWDTYILNPAHANINCGAPKEVVSAVKTYKTATYKSEVTYTCPKGEQLKSLCEKNNKWSPMVKTCKDPQIHFVKVSGAALDVPGKILWYKKNVTAEACAEKCLSEETCSSFEITKEAYVKPVMLKKVSLPEEDTVKQFTNMDLNECNKACSRYAGCNSYQYNQKDKICGLNKVTQLTEKLKPNKGNKDAYFLTPAFKNINCGRPKRIANALKAFKTTTYNSEVTYTCPGGKELKATCKEDNQWVPTVSSCKVAQNHFIRVKDAILEVSGKILWKKEKVTADMCAEKCLSDITCLSFEITKENGKCYLSKEGAANSKKIDTAKSRDYYQQIQPNDEFVAFKKAFIPGYDTFPQLTTMSLMQCYQACHKTLRCNSFEYHERRKLCNRSNVTHLTHNLIPNKEGWDIYLINPDFQKIDCGPPKDVAGAVKVYRSTTFKSLVTYNCPSGGVFKSMCEKDKIWTPVPPTCEAYANIDCGTPKEVVGALKSYKTTIYKSVVTYTCPKGEQLKSICEMNNKWTPVAKTCKADEKPIILKKVSIPKKFILEKLKHKTLQQCNETCYQHPVCSSYEYNKKAKLCALSKVAQLSGKLKPNYGSWDVFMIHQAYTNVDCGPPKDIDRTLMSYSTTTYKSEVIYTCHEGEKLKSVCKEDNKWTPVVSSCKVSKLNFVKVKDAVLDTSKKTLWNKKHVTTDACAQKCLSYKNCLSFDINKVSGDCYFSKQSASFSKKLKPTEGRDYYQRLRSYYELFTIKNAAIPGQANLGQLRNVELKECAKACYQIPGCKSFEYNERAKICYRGNVNHLIHDLEPSKSDSDSYIINPAYSNVNCGPPKDVVGALKSYKTTTYKSEVTYTCPKGDQIKSTCEKHKIWSQVTPTCNDPQINFAKVKGAIMDVPGKILWQNKNVTVETCAEKCLSNKKCLSFEINKEKGKCFLSQQAASSSKKIRATTSRDYYQRVKFDDKPLVMKHVNVRKKATLGQIKRVNLIQCGKACDEFPGCNSYQYNAKDKICDLSNVTHLTDEFKPNDGKWDIYVINPVVSKIDCGPPKDVVGAFKYYSSTTYKSEVTYFCRDGEKLKAACKEDNKWTPEVSCKIAKNYFVKVKGAALAVSGKTLWDKQNVTAEACAEKCLSDKNCLSFEIKKEMGKCFLSKQTAASSKKIKKAKNRNYYQRIKPDVDFLTLKRTNILMQDNLGRLHNVSLKECDEACYELAECKSYEYKEKTKICDLSNVTHLTHHLQPNIYGWDIHIINPVLAKINCGPPNEIVGTKKSYTTTTYKSEVIYTCPEGRKLKSVCKRDTKWTSVPPCEAYADIDCGNPKDIVGALKSYTDTTYKSEVTYTCPEGDQLKSTCEINNKWTLVAESCKGNMEQIMFKNVSIPEKTTIGQFEDMTLKECNETCYSIEECNTFLYNEQAMLCDLSNGTLLTHKLKPNKDGWDIYIVNPAITRVECGPPKDVVGAKKSYTNTSYKSEVTYTCPGNEILKSICKDNSKWTPVTSDCEDAKLHFVKVKDAILDTPKKTLWNKKHVTADECAHKCLFYTDCLIFEIDRGSRTCYFSKQSAASAKKLKPKKGRDYYQRINSNDEVLRIKSTSIPGQDTFGRLENVSLKECHKVCHQTPRCRSFEYKEKAKTCSRSNVTHLTHDLEPNKENWDTYIINPALFNIDCGPPKEVVNAVKSYKTTTYKSEVTYTCPKGEQLKSTCGKDNKWTPVTSACNDTQIHFVKIKDASLDETGKTLWDKEDVTVHECAGKCLLDEKCLSFEMNKENKKCYLSEKSASSSDKLKKNKNKDYYQRVKPDEPLKLKRVSVPSKAILGKLKNKSLKECNEACFQYQACSAYQYNEKTKLCELSNATQLNNELKPSNEGWDIYIPLPALTKIDCGPPKEVPGTFISYNTTTYKSVVTYTCQDGEILKAACKENNEWTPEVSCKVAQIHFVKVKGAALDIAGKSLWKEKKVTPEACANECLTDKKCLSFEIKKKSGKCYLSKETAATSKEIKSDNSRDYYQKVKPYDDLFTFKKTSIPEKDTLKRLKNKSLKDCYKACYKNSECHSFEYNKKAKFCDQSNATHLTDDLQPNKKGWDTYVFNPVNDKINCGPPRDIVGASKSYSSTTYRGEVTYTCPHGEKLKSKCGKDYKWTSVNSTCEAYKDIDCGNPKDIAGAANSYEATTYKSEVTYTCPEGEKIKSICEKDNKWTPIVETCDADEGPIILKKVSIPIQATLGRLKDKTLMKCKKACQQYVGCNSYQYNADDKLCDLSNVTQLSDNVLKPNDGKWDIYIANPVITKVDCGLPKDVVGAKKSYTKTTYKSEVTYTCPGRQKLKSRCKDDNKWTPVASSCKADKDILKFEKTSIPREDTFKRLENVTVKECDHACHQTPGCNSYEYNEKAKFCDQSDATHLTHDLQPDQKDWDTYVINPAYSSINCGPPKDIDGTSKSYKTTAYKSEVLYTCSDGVQLKSICEKDNKWTPVASSCNDPQLHFVKIKDAALDVPGKTLLDKEDVTADECAKRCLSDESCLSFEITKGNGKCYLSEKTAATSKKLKGNKDRDYYQRLKLDDKPFMMKKVSIPKKATIKELQGMKLKECDEACSQYARCNSYQYNKKEKICDLSHATELNNELMPNDGSWDLYIINPVVTKVDCGAPKVVVGASKSYNTTNYKSEVIYTCQKGEILKATCKENRKWFPVVSCKADDDLFTFKRTAIPKHNTFGRIKGVSLKECDRACLQIPGCKSYEYHEKYKFCNPSNETHLTYDLKPNKNGWDIHIMNPVYSKIKCGRPRKIAGLLMSYNSTAYRSEVTYTCPDGEELKSKCDKDKKWTSVDSVCEVFKHIDCGNPKEIAGAAKSYETTTYKSEVTYTCPKGEKLKSTCEKDKKWTPIVEICKGNINGLFLVLSAYVILF
ncbi:von Willebrand factor type A, EGF and pentraxin domain-containing 1-like [Octopus vulgaris]|uniref:von Willebrand factor type A, EGF and pentraxin domain-containing 1-like n=1 Tax=Octopus vulgaris TaxID=6645 RepID=A0AA36B6I2_OCTVU|nr:von Willebrand factor type A, EGF and pentraxin domain-containing 1-like [Octopus vulgaris]